MATISAESSSLACLSLESERGSDLDRDSFGEGRTRPLRVPIPRLRGWHRRALENPEIEVTRNGVRLPYRAIAVSGAEREGIVRDYPLPWAIRFLTGFPPRLFLRLDARPG